MLFINTAVCRRPKIKSSDKRYGVGREYSLKNLQALAQKSKDEGVKVYYKYAIDVIKEVRESEAPIMMPEMFYKVNCCGKEKCCCPSLSWMQWLPTKRMWALMVLCSIFVGALTLVSLYTHPEAYLMTMKADWLHILVVVVSYMVVVTVLFSLAMVMMKITMMFRKATALMRIPSNPMDFVGNRVRKDMSAQDGGNRAFQYYLNNRMHIITPEFLRAWSSLRQHIQQWEISYFYELTQPIISLEIIFVLFMILVGLIGLFLDEYDGDIRLFFFNLVSESNVIMTLLLFSMLVIITLLVHLVSLLMPYQEQKAHEAWTERLSLSLQIEEANLHSYVADRNLSAATSERDTALYKDFQTQTTAIENTRSLLESLKAEMAENRTAPKLLGVLTLNETLIQTLIGTVTTALTAFLSSFFTGILTDIGESSGFLPTEQPTFAPTMAPTS